jgi:chaperonin cofactor prefoldin
MGKKQEKKIQKISSKKEAIRRYVEAVLDDNTAGTQEYNQIGAMFFQDKINFPLEALKTKLEGLKTELETLKNKTKDKTAEDTALQQNLEKKETTINALVDRFKQYAELQQTAIQKGEAKKARNFIKRGISNLFKFTFKLVKLGLRVAVKLAIGLIRKVCQALELVQRGIERLQEKARFNEGKFNEELKKNPKWTKTKAFLKGVAMGFLALLKLPVTVLRATLRIFGVKSLEAIDNKLTPKNQGKAFNFFDKYTQDIDTIEVRKAQQKVNKLEKELLKASTQDQTNSLYTKLQTAQKELEAQKALKTNSLKEVIKKEADNIRGNSNYEHEFNTEKGVMEALKKNFLQPDSKKEVSAMRDTAVKAMVNDKDAGTMEEAKQNLVQAIVNENNKAAVLVEQQPPAKANEQAKAKLTTLQNIKGNVSAAFRKKDEGRKL